MTGLILRGVGGLYSVEPTAGSDTRCAGQTSENIVFCVARGIFRKHGMKPLPGDAVEFEMDLHQEGHGSIRAIKQRKTELARPAVANATQLLIVVSRAEPAPDFMFVDKLAIMALAAGVRPAVFASKPDLPAGEGFDYELEGYERAGFPVVRACEAPAPAVAVPATPTMPAMSVTPAMPAMPAMPASPETLETPPTHEMLETPATPETLETLVTPATPATLTIPVTPVTFATPELMELLRGHVTVIAGQSGVGKSTIVNAIVGREHMAVGEISRRIRRGRNTTRHAELVPLAGGGYAVDTPGFSALEADGPAALDAEWRPAGSLSVYYPELAPYDGRCRFAGCSHVHEPGCEAIAAVLSGGLHAGRHARYAEFCRQFGRGRPTRPRA